MRVSNSISRIEFIFCFLVWFLSVLYAMYRVRRYNEFFTYYEDKYEDFSSGWSLLNRKRDTADAEWNFFLLYLYNAFPWFIISIIVTEILRYKKCSKALDYWQILISFSFIIYNHGYTHLMYLLIQPFLFELVSYLKSKTALWICNILWLYFTCVTLVSYKLYYELFDMEYFDYFHIAVAVGWLNMHCLSYYIDKLDNKANNTYNVISMLAYMFYLPTFYAGPFIFYTDFQKSRNFENMLPLNQRIKTLFCKLLRFGFWMLFLEFILHYQYISAFSFQLKLVSSFDTWALYGYGYSMAQFFYIKYLVMYGLSTTIAEFESISVPNVPKCIGGIHLYSDMWKTFDCSLHRFLLQYVYLPTMKNKSLKSKIFSTFLSFSFVCAWHGGEYHLFIWTCYNFIEITIELIYKYVYSNYLQHIKFVKKLSPQWKIRIACLMSSPLLAMSAISNFYFFAGALIGDLFIKKFFNDAFTTNLLVFFILYCCCIVSTDLKLQKEKIKHQ